MIYNIHNENQDNLEKIDFNVLKMNEKIDCLQEYLPKLLVDNKNLYGVLSKGIHELDEKSCLKYFPFVKLGIELILDERLASLEKSRKSVEFHKELQKISSEVGV